MRRRKRFLTTRKIKVFLSLIVLLGLIYLFKVIDWSSNDEVDYYSTFPLPPEDYVELRQEGGKTIFSIWAPEAEQVRLLLYKDGIEGHASEMLPLEQDVKTGVWLLQLNRPLIGWFYAFNLKYEGVWKGDTPGLMAKAVGINGKRAAIIDWDKTNPTTWSSDQYRGVKTPADAIIYSMHIRDFTGSKSSGAPDSIRGKYLGVSYSGSDYEEVTTALNHLKELGVTHVKLMPTADFLAVDERLYNEPEAYDWGFETLNYSVPEGLYSTDPANPYRRIYEFKEMVQQLHNAGIGVIMDVDYVLSFNAFQTSYERIVPGYFFYKDLDKRKGYQEFGIDKYLVATSRPFVKQIILSSLKYWMNEYHIDGFCIDKVDMFAPTTLREITTNLKQSHPNSLILGNYSSIATYKSVAKLDSIPYISGESLYFYNYMRPEQAQNTYLLGYDEAVEFMKLSIVGGVRHAGLDQEFLAREDVIYNDSPIQSINRLSSYKGLVLTDYLKKYSANNAEALRLNKLAYTTLLTSQGIAELYEGDEFLRSKNGLDHTLHQGDIINQLNWKLKNQNLAYYEYISSLVKLRREHPAFRMSSAQLISDHLEFISTSNPLSVAYRLKENANGDEWEDIIVVVNSSKSQTRLTLPEGRYIVVCRDGQFHAGGLSYAYGQLVVNPQTVSILYRTSKDIVLPPKPKVETPLKEVIIPKREELLPDKIIDLDFTPALRDKPDSFQELNKIKIKD